MTAETGLDAAPLFGRCDSCGAVTPDIREAEDGRWWCSVCGHQPEVRGTAVEPDDRMACPECGAALEVPAGAFTVECYRADGRYCRARVAGPLAVADPAAWSRHQAAQQAYWQDLRDQVLAAERAQRQAFHRGLVTWIRALDVLER